ncbi:MAG: hypothetical protein Q4F25_02250, partial [Eubacteriales bacterium]|nr:hypothetical protein [Eubacteriales bacterium]
YDDKAPFINLKVGPVFEELRSKIGKGYFEQLIKRYMLDNPHRAIVVMTPETGLTEKMTARLREKLDALAASLTKEERQKIIDDLAGLRQWQEKEESEEDRAKIPMLSRDELDKKARPYVNVVEKVDATEGVTLISHPLTTGGIDYLTFMFDISQLPARFFPYLGIFKTLIGVLDTEKYSYADLDQEVNIMTGGVGSTIGIYTIEGEPGRYRMMMEITSKALHANMKSVFDLVQEIAMRTKWNSPARILEVLEEERAGMQAELPAAGHATALVRAKSYFSEPSMIMDSFSGITGFRTLDRICSVLEKTRGAKAAAGGEDEKGAVSADGAAVAESTACAAGGKDTSGALCVAQEPEEIMEILAEMAGYMFRADRLMVDCTAEQEDLAAVKEEIAVFCRGLHPSQTAEQDLAQYGERFAITPVRKNEGFTTAGQVQFVCRAGRFDRKGLTYTGAMRVLRVILGYEYLWYKVRMTGGAYGCMSGFSRDGSAFFVSYRDPHLGQTLETFEDAPAFIREYEADERAMTKSIIGAVSVLDHPMTPPVYGKYSLTGYITGVSIEKLQKERDELLSCTVEDIRALADQLDEFLDENCLCVVGSDEKLRSQEERFDAIDKLI